VHRLDQIYRASAVAGRFPRMPADGAKGQASLIVGALWVHVSITGRADRDANAGRSGTQHLALDDYIHIADVCVNRLNDMLDIYWFGACVA
jgi:hypothetical protein